MKRNQNIQDWLQRYDTPAIPEEKRNALISAGQRYMDSAEFNSTSLQSVL